MTHIVWDQTSPFINYFAMKVLKLQGWSAFAAEPISRGNFVCQYAGELMNNDQSQKRLRIYDGTQNSAGHALLVSRTLYSYKV